MSNRDRQPQLPMQPNPPKITTVDFHGAQLLAIVGDSPATTMIAMKPVVEGMGLDWTTQHRKIHGHPVLAEGVGIMPIPSSGGQQVTTCLSLDALPFWLATINTNKLTDPAMKERVLLFQRECAKALSAHFFGSTLPVPANDLDERTNGIVRSIIHKVTDLQRAFTSQTQLVTSLQTQLTRQEQERAARDAQHADQIAELRQIVLDRTEAARWVSPLDVLVQQNVPPKGRRPLAVRVGNQLSAFAAQRGSEIWQDPNLPSIIQLDVVQEWLAFEGSASLKPTRSFSGGNLS